MKAIIASLFVILLGASLAARADDSVWAQKIHRLEYIHFNPVAQTVEWAISGGAVNDAGEFVPGDSGLCTYSINLTNGMMTHNGEDGVLSPGAAGSMLRALSSLSQLMQGYTENWEGVPSSPTSSTDGDKDAQPSDSHENLASALGLSLISQLSKGFTPRSAAGHFNTAHKHSRRALQHGIALSMESAAH